MWSIRDRSRSCVSSVFSAALTVLFCAGGQNEFHRNPLDGATPLDRQWIYQAAMPGRQLARRIRDARLLKQFRGTPAEQAMQEYMQKRMKQPAASDYGNGKGQTTEAAIVAEASSSR